MKNGFNQGTGETGAARPRCSHGAPPYGEGTFKASSSSFLKNIYPSLTFDISRCVSDSYG